MLLSKALHKSPLPFCNFFSFQATEYLFSKSICIQEKYDLRIFVKPENQKARSSVINPIMALELFFSEVRFAFVNSEKGYRFY